MAYAKSSFLGDGSTRIFSVAFPYISQTYVEVRVNNILKTVTTDYIWLTSSTIQFVTAPANGLTIDLLRNTPKSTKLVNFQDAAVLRNTDLNLSADQTFQVMQEALDNLSGTSLGITTIPTDNSVSTIKLVDQAITEPKLAQAVFNDLTPVSADTLDHVVIADTSDLGNKKKTLISSILSLIASATTAVIGLVRLATTAETQAGASAAIAITPAGLGACVLGMGQTWQNLTGSRVASTAYTNSTGRSIQVSVSLVTSIACTLNYTVGGVTGTGSSYGAASGTTYASFIVPNGASYSVVNNGGTSVVGNWLELR